MFVIGICKLMRKTSIENCFTKQIKNNYRVVAAACIVKCIKFTKSNQIFQTDLEVLLLTIYNINIYTAARVKFTMIQYNVNIRGTHNYTENRSSVMVGDF